MDIEKEKEKEIYFELIEKHFNKDKEKEKDNFILSLLFVIFINKKYSIKEKYNFLGNSLNNIFVTKECKNEVFSLFSKIQKTYFALIRFKYLIILKKSKLVVENDLSLNPISPLEKYVITIQQKNNKYLFHIRDIIHIINSSIGHSSFFFSSPMPVKNPYNNVVFSKSILYNIYFFMKFNTFLYSELFHYYFLCDFDLTNFNLKNGNLLRKYAIQDYFKNSTKDNLIMDIEEMLEDFNFENRLYQINIDKDFSSKKLLEIMKPYLNIYLKSKYSYNYNEKSNAHHLLKKKLKEFFIFNPHFGRKIIKINNYFSNNKNNKNIIESDIIFDENHIFFYKNNKKPNDFLDSHSILKDE